MTSAFLIRVGRSTSSTPLFLRDLFGDVRIVCDHRHVKGLEQFSDLATDPPIPHNAPHLPIKVRERAEIVPRPDAIFLPFRLFS